MLESALKEQLKGIFAGLEANFAFDISVSSSHENKTELLELLGDVADCSDHITYSVNEGNGLKFTLLKNGNATGITFRGIPNGHEFTSLLLAQYISVPASYHQCNDRPELVNSYNKHSFAVRHDRRNL